MPEEQNFAAKDTEKAATSAAAMTSKGNTAEARASTEPDLRVLLREAAWSRMFGKATAIKNPFSR